MRCSVFWMLGPTKCNTWLETMCSEDQLTVVIQLIQSGWKTFCGNVFCFFFCGHRTYSIYGTLEGSITLQRWDILSLSAAECDWPLSSEEAWMQGAFMLTKRWLKFAGWLSGLSEGNWKANCIISFEQSLKMSLLHIPVAPCGSFCRVALRHPPPHPPPASRSDVISCGYWSFPVSSI